MNTIKKFESFSDSEIDDLFIDIENLLLFDSDNLLNPVNISTLYPDESIFSFFRDNFNPFTKRISFKQNRPKNYRKGNNNTFYTLYNCDKTHISDYIVPCLTFLVELPIENESYDFDDLLGKMNRIIRFDPDISIYYRFHSKMNIPDGKIARFELVILKIDI